MLGESYDPRMEAMAGRNAGRLLFVVPCLLLLAGDSTAQDTWPARGDAVHIAASFKNLSAPSGAAGGRTRYDMPACVRLRIAKAKPAKSLWTIEDAMGGKAELQGPWLSRMHKGKMECEAQLAAEGEPVLARNKDRYTLAQKPKGSPAGKEKPK